MVYCIQLSCGIRCNKSVLGMKEQIASIIYIVIVAQMFLQGVYANHCILYDPSTRTITAVCGSASLSDIDEQAC